MEGRKLCDTVYTTYICITALSAATAVSETKGKHDKEGKKTQMKNYIW